MRWPMFSSGKPLLDLAGEMSWTPAVHVRTCCTQNTIAHTIDFPLHVGPVDCAMGQSVASLLPNMVGVNS